MADKLERQLQQAAGAHQAGRFEEAERLYLKLARRLRREPRLAFYLGTLYLQTGKPAEAVEQLTRAVKLAPDNADGHFNLGIARAQTGDLHGARDSYLSATALQPDALEPRNNLAGVLQQLGEAGRAAESFTAAARIAPGNVEVRVNLALTLEMINDLSGAGDAVAAALALVPDHIGGRLLAAQLKLRRGEHEAAAGDLRQLLADDPDDQYAGEAGLSLAQALERAGDIDGAFQAMQTGNSAGARYFAASGLDGSRYRGHIESCRDYFTPERLSANETRLDAAPDPASPVFFVGFPRSGTTLLEQILDAHPGLHTTAERSPLDPIMRDIAQKQGAYPDGLAQLRAADRQRLRKLFWQSAERDHGGPLGEVRLVDKMPFNLVELGLVHWLFPSAPVLVALRDPRDVCLSCFAQTFIRNDAMANFQDLETTAETYRLVMDLWLDQREHLGNPWLEYRYEDLVADPKATARRIFDFIGADWRDEVITDRLRAGARYVSTPSRDAVSGEITSRAVARWRKFEKHLRPILPTLAPYVERFGYTD